MANLAKNILITGLPGSGKTTLIMKLADELREYGPVGFATGEIRLQGTRTGFRITSLDQRRTGILAHVEITGPHRVGKYGVDLGGFEAFLDSLHLLEPSPRLVIIDEIGKMECLSAKFRGVITSLLTSNAAVIATIAMKGEGFIDEVKSRPGTILYELTQRNRDTLLQDIAGLVRSLISSRA